MHAFLLTTEPRPVHTVARDLLFDPSEADVKLLYEGRVQFDKITTARHGRVGYGCKGGLRDNAATDA